MWLAAADVTPAHGPFVAAVGTHRRDAAGVLRWLHDAAAAPLDRASGPGTYGSFRDDFSPRNNNASARNDDDDASAAASRGGRAADDEGGARRRRCVAPFRGCGSVEAYGTAAAGSLVCFLCCLSSARCENGFTAAGPV